MSDEFLYQLREPPRPEFAEALKARVFHEPLRSPTVRRVCTGLVVFWVALIVVACVAPQTRTPILRATETVVAQSREVITRLIFVSDRGVPSPVMIFPCGENGDVRMESLSVEEAQQRVPFQIRIPTWVPEGLKMGPVTLMHPEGVGDWVIYIGWLASESGGAPLSLQIEGPGVQQFWVRCPGQWQNVRVAVEAMEATPPPDDAAALPVPPQPPVKVEVVEFTPPPVEIRTLAINGKSTHLTVMREKAPYPFAMLQWVREEDNVSYTLTANLDWVSLEDLIRVAETIR